MGFWDRVLMRIKAFIADGDLVGPRAGGLASTTIKRAMLAALGLTFLSGAPNSAPVDCGTPYVAFHERLSHNAENMSGERLAALHRGSLRIFDACDAGRARRLDEPWRGDAGAWAGNHPLR